MSRYLLAEVFLFMCSIHFASTATHSHYFYLTATNQSTVDFPSFTMTRTLDDIVLFWYDSDNEVVERRVPWFKSPYATLLDASINYYGVQKSLQRLLANISQELNHTEGSHILQRLEGCTLSDNGTVHTSFSYRYDGKPFMSFNVETANWTAETPAAEPYVQYYNSNTTILEANRREMVDTCLTHITELLSLGNCTINRKVPPVVKVTHIPMDNAGVRLYCRAYGHYPENILIRWYKNGEQIPEKMMERVTLPIPGLTYLTSLSVNVTSLADDLYTCRVNHSSMPRDYIQNWRISGDHGNPSRAPSNSLIGVVIAICLAVILVVVVFVFGAVSFAQRRRQ